MNWVLSKNKFPMFYVELRDKIHYYEAIEKGDKGDDEAICTLHYLDINATIYI